MTRTEGAVVSVNIDNLSAYERIRAHRRAEKGCRHNYDGSPCALEPHHEDWHQDSLGRRWP